MKRVIFIEFSLALTLKRIGYKVTVNILEYVHEKYIVDRRISVLCEKLAPFISQNAKLLDVGCGDGFLAGRLMQKRPDITIKGIDVLLRDKMYIPIEVYDGINFPFGDSSFDATMFIDVLHHTVEPVNLLREAVRVSRKAVIIKDHLLNGILACTTLRFMDNIGNCRHGVQLVNHFWSRGKWMRTFDSLGIAIDKWLAHLGIYPWPASLIFDRSLHFAARLTINKSD